MRLRRETFKYLLAGQSGGLQEDAVPLLFIARDPSEGSVYKGGGSLFEGETLESYSLNNSGPVAAKKTHIRKRNNKQRFT